MPISLTDTLLGLGMDFAAPGQYDNLSFMMSL
jgi:hypothetical protein